MRPRLLIACNKADVAGAKDSMEIKKLIEAELDTLKTTRHSIETEGENVDDIILGAEGESFISNTMADSQ